MLPNSTPQQGDNVLRLMALYARIMSGYGWETPLDEIDIHFTELSVDELVIIGHCYIGLAQVKQRYQAGTVGETPTTPSGARDSAPTVSHETELPGGPNGPNCPPVEALTQKLRTADPSLGWHSAWIKAARMLRGVAYEL